MRARLSLLASLLLAAVSVRAAEIEVVPVLVELTRDEKSTVITLRNRSAEPARFQVSLFAWDQAPSGEMKLAPTEEVLAFPRVLTVAPNEAKIIRVGAATPFGAVEKTYRIFIEEMPPAARAERGPKIQVLSRIGLPIFLAPTAPARARPALGPVELTGAKATFTLRNEGNAHLRPSAVKATFLDAQGATLSEQPLEAWYVLAAGERHYDAPAPPARCRDVRAVAVEVTLGGQVLRGRADTPRGACAD